MEIKRLIIEVFIIGIPFLSCTFFPKQERLLAEHKKRDGSKIKIYYLSMGATTNDVIQVRQSNQQSPLWVSEKYNYLKNSSIIGDTILQLYLTDTGYYSSHKFDTVSIKLK